MNEERAARLKALEDILDYRFRDETLLNHALIHRSYTNEFSYLDGKNNERLEFLGDAVLDLCVSDLLMQYFPDETEGRLSKRRAACVNERSLAEIARRFHLGECLLLGKGEELSGGRSKASLLANAFEAVLAAIYIDGGFDRVSAFLRRLFANLVKEGMGDILYTDHKTILQEACQLRFREPPRYTVIRESGPDHDKTFDVRLDVADRMTAFGTGKNRKEAEQAAAKKALECLEGPRTPEGGAP
jgi:ribonuclease III